MTQKGTPLHYKILKEAGAAMTHADCVKILEDWLFNVPPMRKEGRNIDFFASCLLTLLNMHAAQAADGLREQSSSLLLRLEEAKSELLVRSDEVSGLRRDEQKRFDDYRVALLKEVDTKAEEHAAKIVECEGLRHRLQENEAAWRIVAQALDNPTLEASADSSLEMELAKLIVDKAEGLRQELAELTKRNDVLRRRIHHLEKHNQYFFRCESGWCNPAADFGGDPVAECIGQMEKRAIESEAQVEHFSKQNLEWFKCAESWRARADNLETLYRNEQEWRQKMTERAEKAEADLASKDLELKERTAGRDKWEGAWHEATLERNQARRELAEARQEIERLRGRKS